jgi:hypothetical protein
MAFYGIRNKVVTMLPRIAYHILGRPSVLNLLANMTLGEALWVVPMVEN